MACLRLPNKLLEFRKPDFKGFQLKREIQIYAKVHSDKNNSFNPTFIFGLNEISGERTLFCLALDVDNESYFQQHSRFKRQLRRIDRRVTRLEAPAVTEMDITL